MLEKIKVKESFDVVAKTLPFAIKTNLKKEGAFCVIEYNNTDINNTTKETAKECLKRYLTANDIKIVSIK